MSKEIVQEALAVAELVDKAASAQLHGSFSERNPALGKMRRCPYCKKRYRENGIIPHCSAKYVVEFPSEKV